MRISTFGIQSLADVVRYGRLRWFGHQGPNSQKLTINLGIIFYIKTCLSFTEVYCKFLRIWPLDSDA